MKEIQIVCCRYCENIVPRVPCSVEDLSVEIQELYAHFIPFSFRRWCDLLMPEDLAKSCHVT